ncbi:unnamed protein product [Citrullus colocynthis]|uniref:Uncharacterized protein n=1 Tax=Citrullus colocynthis TaxID=252529 RepID=A0ABP0XYW1_9ROSI
MEKKGKGDNAQNHRLLALIHDITGGTPPRSFDFGSSGFERNSGGAVSLSQAAALRSDAAPPPSCWTWVFSSPFIFLIKGPAIAISLPEDMYEIMEMEEKEDLGCL